MTPTQLAWARLHDWCLCTNEAGGSVAVRDVYTLGGLTFEDVLTFTSYSELRSWAGY